MEKLLGLSAFATSCGCSMNANLQYEYNLNKKLIKLHENFLTSTIISTFI